MYHGIQHFMENGIPELEKIQKFFMENPSRLEECAVHVKQIMLELGCGMLSEMVEECNTMLEESLKRREHWQIKDRCVKHLLTSLGTVSFTHTRFQHKTTRETVMRHVHRINLSPYRKEEEAEKRRVKYLYVEADEDHIALQFHKKKGDIKRWKGHGDNSQIIKLVYVHEGYKEGTGKRRQLKEAVYSGGLYGGKENGKLWEEVKDYIRERYDTEALERIYFQSDGGSWMKKGTEMLGATFVLDEFHLKKYVKRMARAAGDPEQEKVVIKYLERGEKKKLEEWAEEKGKCVDEKKRKRLEESLGYIKKNWKGIRTRLKREEGVIGSSTESHISHVLSARMSSRPMGWSREGAGKLSGLRIHWKNGRKMEELLEPEKAEGKKKEEERIFSAKEMINWEKRSRKRNGKYVEALQARVSRQTGMKVYFQAAISRICG